MPKPYTPFDLNVLCTPPAFILSQDQTLENILSKRAPLPLAVAGFASAAARLNHFRALIALNLLFFEYASFSEFNEISTRPDQRFHARPFRFVLSIVVQFSRTKRSPFLRALR